VCIELSGSLPSRHREWAAGGALVRDRAAGLGARAICARVAVSAALFCGAAFLVFAIGSPGVALAQVNCQAIPAGPARTDCYIGLSRLYRQKSELAADVARQQASGAIYRQVTGARPNTDALRSVPAW
jgi:hypothetical protein